MAIPRALTLITCQRNEYKYRKKQITGGKQGLLENHQRLDDETYR